MPETYELSNFDNASPAEIEAALEQSDVVFFPQCPIELPSDEDLAFLRTEVPQQSQVKNISYHPESDSVPGFDAPAAVQRRTKSILKNHRGAVAEFLEKHIPDLAPGWTVGTTSFRAVEEGGRDLEPRASSEIVHIDAGAYGATNGNRILRFFVNLNPDTDRVWGTKGSFHELFGQHDEFGAAARGGTDRIRVRKGALDHCFSGLVKILSKIYPLAKVIDSSPYDRAMRRIHNYMKESQEFREDESDYREIRFPPYSAWSVFTDGISHSVVSGQYALTTTVLIPLDNCKKTELAPYNVLAAAD